MEDKPFSGTSFTPEERCAVQHYESNDHHMEGGRFVVPFLRRDSAKLIGKSKSLVVRRFLSLERSLHFKGQLGEFNVMKEYFDLGHAKIVPLEDLERRHS